VASLTPAAKRAYQGAVSRARYDLAFFAQAWFGYQLSPWQQEDAAMAGRINVHDAGRRAGKSTITLIKRTHDLLFNGPNREGYVAGPSIDQAMLYFNELEAAAGRSALMEQCIRISPQGKLVRHTPFPEVHFITGGKMMARATARDGMYLRGKGANWVAVTEAAFIKDKVYNQVIRALVLDRKGRIDLESTPNGDNYFKRLFDRAMYKAPASQYRRQDQTGRYQAVYATVHDNPRLSPEDIEDIRQEVPDYVWQTEYLALFLSDADAVFPWELLAELFDDDYPMQPGPIPNHVYSIGVDLAQVRDYTAIIVLDVTKPPYTVAAWRRYKGKLYTGPDSVASEVNLLRRTFDNCPVYIDATTERGVAEQVEGSIPFIFSPSSRNALFSNMQVLAQKRQYALPPSFTILRNELLALRRMRTAHHSVRIDHPSDGFDDCCIALGLASMAVQPSVGEADSEAWRALSQAQGW
jgi:Terminase large subunit, T4likevirus-type, N-terminal